MCVQLPSKWQSRAVGRLEGDRLLGDQSMGINCCGNHLDYSASGKLEVCLFVKNRILHRAVGRLGLQTHGGNWRLPRKRGREGQHQEHTLVLCRQPSRLTMVASSPPHSLAVPARSCQMPWVSPSPLSSPGPSPAVTSHLNLQLSNPQSSARQMAGWAPRGCGLIDPTTYCPT